MSSYSNMLHLVAPLSSTYFYLQTDKSAFCNIPVKYTDRFSFFHNLALQIFSTTIFTQLLLSLFIYGVHPIPQYYMCNPWINKLVWYFYLSKYYEYIDTFLLYAKNKDAILLQKYHHAGAVIVWHLGYVYNFDGVFFASLLNSGIHSFMYLYYLLSTIKNFNMRPYKIYMTSLQVGQLGFGVVALPYFYYNIENVTNKYVIIVFDTYILILLFLFCDFMYTTYFSKSKRKLL
jgi:hypothetical protein